MYSKGGYIDPDLLKKHWQEWFDVNGNSQSRNKQNNKPIIKVMLFDKYGNFIMEVPQ